MPSSFKRRVCGFDLALTQQRPMTTRLSHRDFDACSGALRQIYGATSLNEFPHRVLSQLSELVPVEHVTYNEFNDRQQRYMTLAQPARSQIQAFIPQLVSHIHTHPLFD